MVKRVFDLTASLCMLAFLCPFLIIIVIFIQIQSPGPIFYRGIRTGLYGKPFRIFKFRTMVVNAEKMGGPSTALNDPRLTPIGRILRKYKLDELPQLINVLKSEMSVVGPRPQVEEYTKLYNEEEKIVLTVKPGLTDYASVRFINLDQILGNEKVDEKYLKEIEPEKNRLRIKYARDHNFLIDCKLIFITLLQIFRIRSIWNINN